MRLRFRRIAVLAFIAAAATAMPAPAFAQTQIPPLITRGLLAFEEGRCREAFDLWTGEWLSQRDGGRRQELLASCDHLSDVGATPSGYDIFRVIYVTPHLCRVYVVMRYERHPMYLLVVGYAPTDGQWRVTAVTWDRDPDKVFPPSWLDPVGGVQ